ncbi:ion channel [Ruania suaedae]|uniref:potassium channel family protein n=1 Tax=Ruania suaedae TaxID=2897774 RepID=UPI001E5EE795|nr:potassium channel family protein [Ruania suaedae]UFU04377.1 ion channel [Ruania suaedae]
MIAAVWRLSRRLGHRLGSAAGPVGMVGAVVLWVMMQGVGWALIYIGHVPEGFSYSPGIDPSRYHDGAQALYISLVTLATLGFGDVVPTEPVLRWLAPLQALTGFGLLTAALTWFMQIYPPLTRRRALAVRLHGLRESGFADALPALGPAAVHLLTDVAGELDAVGVDLVQHSETYYFRDEEAPQSLARNLSYAVAVRDAARGCASTAEMRVAAALLSSSLEHVAAQLQGLVRAEGSVVHVIECYADDHRRAPN